MASKAFALGVFLFVRSSFAITLILSDFDDTIVETRRHDAYQGTFKTNYILFRIERLGSTIIPQRDEPARLEISPQDFQRIKKSLGEGEGRPGAIKETVKLESGITIHPGYYCLRDPESFANFMESPEGRNYLLEDFMAAEERSPKENFKGPFWDSMVEILKTREGAATFGIVSARGHSIREWREFFVYLKKKKYIEHLPNFSLFKSVSRKDFDRYDVDGKVPERKVAIVKEIALDLRFVPLTESDQRIGPDGKTMGQFHQVLYADDRPDIIEKMTEMFQKLSLSQQVHSTKFGLFHAGTKKEIERTKRPQFYILKDTGTFRRALPGEILSDLSSCANELAG